MPTKRPFPEPSPSPDSTALQAPDAATTALALRIAQVLHEKHVSDIRILDVSGPLVIADYFVIGTAETTRQAQAIARELDALVKAETGHRRRNRGGLESEESNWVLLDFADIVVHLFLAEARAYYRLEELWADARPLAFSPAAIQLQEPESRAGTRQRRIRVLPEEPEGT
ncbi:MAG: hypothetical protein Fur0037_18400 [Planctomycetota bacterium]